MLGSESAKDIGNGCMTGVFIQQRLSVWIRTEVFIYCIEQKILSAVMKTANLTNVQSSLPILSMFSDYKLGANVLPYY